MQEEYTGHKCAGQVPILELTRLPYPRSLGRPGDRNDLNIHLRGCFDWARAFLLDYERRWGRLPRRIHPENLDDFGVSKPLRGWARVWIKRVLEHAEQYPRELRWAEEDRAARIRDVGFDYLAKRETPRRLDTAWASH